MRTTIYLLLNLLLLSCTTKSSFTTSDKEVVKEEVLEMFHRYHQAMKNEGLMAEFDYLDNSEDFFWVPPGFNQALSYDTIKAIIIANSKATQAVDFQWDTVTVYPLSPVIANFSGVVSGAVTDTSGTTNTVRLVESGTVIKRADGWKLLSGQTALIQNP